MVTDSSFGDLVRRHRVAVGLTQEELAERAGISVRGLSDLERGARRSPHRDTVLRLSRALGLQPIQAQHLVAAARRALRPSDPIWNGGRQLPSPSSSLSGCHRGIEDVLRALDDASTLTLTRPGRIGNTQLVLGVGRRIVGDGHEVALVEVASISDSGEVRQTLVAVLSADEQSGLKHLAAVVGALTS